MLRLESHAADFDFWLGVWELTFDDGGTGRNTVTRDLGGHVIVERFDGSPGVALQGTSLSVWSAETGCWRQTWVDSDGNYLDFEGSFADGEMDLRRRRNGELRRMLWHDIGEASLQWDWQRSGDDGASWETLWHIDYRRLA